MQRAQRPSSAQEACPSGTRERAQHQGSAEGAGVCWSDAPQDAWAEVALLLSPRGLCAGEALIGR